MNAVPELTPELLQALNHRAEVRRRFWEANRKRLTAVYPDQYVAVHNGTVAYAGTDLIDVERALRDRGIAVTDTWIEFLPASDQVWIF